MALSSSSDEMGKCEFCGKVDLRSKFKKNKRFCSSACSKGRKTAQQSHQQCQVTTATSTTTTTTGTNSMDMKSRTGNRKWVRRNVDVYTSP